MPSNIAAATYRQPAQQGGTPRETEGRALLEAARRITKMNGGIAVVCEGKVLAEFPLPVAGLMSNESLETVVEQLSDLKEALKGLGSANDILMPLHFIQLAVIPELKITDKGLVDVLNQEFVTLFD